MFYHPQDSKITIAIKHFAFWTALISMFVMFIFLLSDDAKILQKEVTLEIDVKNKVNICLPEDNFPKKTFFDF